MDECTPFFSRMVDLRNRRLSDHEQEELFAHLAHCGSCRELLEFHEDLTAAGDEFAEPSDDALAAVRRRVIDTISGEAIPHRREVVGFRRPFWRRSRFLAAAASVLILFTGIAIGRGIGRATVPETEVLIAALESRAANNLRLQDVEDSPTLISNVAVRPLGGGRVALAFDVAQHLEIQRNLDDPLVNEVLVHAMLDQSSLGSRLKAVSMASTASNGKVQEALIFAMVNDPDLPVRLRALEALTETSFDETIEEGLFHVLQHDDSMQMRLLAVEVLAQSDVSRQRLFEGMGRDDVPFDPALTEAILHTNL
jgi:hypothetical protein